MKTKTSNKMETIKKKKGIAFKPPVIRRKNFKRCKGCPTPYSCYSSQMCRHPNHK